LRHLACPLIEVFDLFFHFGRCHLPRSVDD
jgi:hypothetical protein